MLAELLEEDPLGMQVTLHPVWVYNLSESTSKNETVKTIEDSRDIGGIFMQECLHGVPPEVRGFLSNYTIPQKEEHHPILVAAVGRVLKEAGSRALRQELLYG